MRNRTIRRTIFVAALIVPITIATAQTAAPVGAAPAQVQGRGGRRNPPPPGPPHDAHDLNGTWLGVPNGLGGGSGGRPQTASQWSPEPMPFTPAGLAKFMSNLPGKGPRQGVPAKGNDPLSDANVPGLLRTLVYGRPFQFLTSDDKIVQTFEWFRIWREIWTDGRKPPADPDPRLYGYSVSHWDGDTLVVETVGLDPRLWGDEWGMPFTDEMKLEERWHRLDRDNLTLSIAFTDPKFYTKPWTSELKRFRLQTKGMQDAEMLEVIFTPMDEKDFDKNIRDPSSLGVAGPKSGVK